MTSSRLRDNAQRILETVGLEISDPIMHELIEAPLNDAIEHFVFPTQPIGSHDELVACLSRFVATIQWGKSKSLQLVLSAMEAIVVLEDLPGGYAAAVLGVARDSDTVLPEILQFIVDKIRDRRRNDYKQWVIHRHINSCDWQTKVAMAKNLLDRMELKIPGFSGGCSNCRPEQFANQLGRMVFMAKDMGLLVTSSPLAAV